MQILFAISMLCFFTLLGAILALLKRALLAQRLLERVAHPPTEDQISRLANPNPFARSQSHQDVHDIAPHKQPDWRFMVNTDRALEPRQESVPTPARKRPQATSFGTLDRLDWAYFNKNLGDLSDPYAPQRSSGTSGTVSIKS